MASVFRQDTGELLGHLTSLEGPLARGITYWPFKAWPHSDGKLHAEPEPLPARTGQPPPLPAVTLNIPVRNTDDPDVHLIVPPELVDFIVTHDSFRAAPVSLTCRRSSRR
jgi:hypothetical protein